MSIRHQIQEMEYISSKSIQNIEMTECRRTSNFEKNLRVMQELAKKQEERFTGLLRNDIQKMYVPCTANER